MAAPHVTRISKIGFNSKTRTVKNLSPQIINGATYDDTNQFPQNAAMAPVAGPLWASMSFDTEMNPSGSAAGAKTPPDALLYKACGFKETVATTVSTTYAWTGATTDVTAVALTSRTGDGTGYYQTCSNAVGGLSIACDPRGVPICSWGFTGTTVAATEATLTDALSNGGAAPSCIGTCTLNSDTLVMKRFAMNFNQILNGPNLSMAHTNGVANPNIVGGIPTFTVVVDLPAFSVANYYTDWSASSLIPFSLALGSGAGYVITITGSGWMNNYQQLSMGANSVLSVALSYRMDTISDPIEIAYT